MKGSRFALMLCLVLLSAEVVAEAEAEGKRSAIVVDGNDWMQSTSVERRAFLIGVANMLIAEAAYATHKGHEAPPVGKRLSMAVSNMTLPDIEARVTAWYEAHAADRGKPVMVVLWLDLVKAKH